MSENSTFSRLCYYTGNNSESGDSLETPKVKTKNVIYFFIYLLLKLTNIFKYIKIY